MSANWRYLVSVRFGNLEMNLETDLDHSEPFELGMLVVERYI